MCHTHIGFQQRLHTKRESPRLKLRPARLDGPQGGPYVAKKVPSCKARKAHTLPTSPPGPGQPSASAGAAAPLLLRPTPPPPPPDHHHRAPPTPTPPITGHRLLPQNPLAEEQHQTPSPSIHQRGRDDDGRPAPQAGGPGAAPPRSKQRRRQPRGRREPHRIHPKGHPHGVRAGDPTPVRPSFPHPYPTHTITPSPTPPTPTPNPAATRS